MTKALSPTEDQSAMRRAIACGRRGAGRVAPNPLVGAAITEGTRILSEGAHECYGQAHAEVNAFDTLGNEHPRSTLSLYVTLEPCCHTGKTPPCTERILREGVRRVVVGCEDPFPAVSGKGTAQLRAAGVQVVTGVLEAECRWLNRRFLCFHQQKRPYIILKWAQSSDGYIAPEPAKRLTLSGPEAQRYVHEMRKQEAAVLVGYRTALIDNPQLNVRLVDNPHQLQPQRIVLDPKAQLPLSLRLFSGQPATLFYSQAHPAEPERARLYQQLGPDRELVPALCKLLHQQGLLSLVVEGGTNTLAQFLAADCWDEIHRISCPQRLHTGLAAPALSGLTAKATLTLGQDQLQIITREAAYCGCDYLGGG